jgi:pre-mRNA-splicing factor SYF2
MGATAEQTSQAESTNTDLPPSREERFKALRSRLATSTKANHAEVIAEHKRMKLDPSHLAKLDRKKAEAEMKLTKQDAEDAGEDYERKRAWDWTMEESEAWDQRRAQKQRNRDESGFAGNLGFRLDVLNNRLYASSGKVLQTRS